MKITFLAAIAMFSSMTAFATVHTVSNMTPSPGQFTSVNDAIAAASSGDTIYVHGSTFNYNAATINKPLTIIGTGHHVPNQNPLTSDIDYITFTAGSSGTKLIGLNLYYLENNSANLANITVTRCRIRYQIRWNQNAQNWTIDGNIFEYSAIILQANNLDIDNSIFKNNIFNGYPQNFNYSNNNTNLVFANNLFLNPSIAFSEVRYAYIYNNIFYRANPSNNTSGCDFQNNLSYQCANNAFPGGVNYTNVDPMFVNFPTAGAYFSYAHDFHLQPGSPAINAGNDGTDLGVYGGLGNFEQNGIPAIPQIRSFTINGSNVVAPGGTININNASRIDVSKLLTVTRGTLNITASAGLTIKSSATSNANIAPLVSGISDITGNLSIESFFTGGLLGTATQNYYRGTRLVSTPIDDSGLANKSYKQLQNFMIITGANGGGFDIGNFERPYATTITKFNEAPASQSFPALTNINNAAPAG
ncbi:MAG: hypothetical protein EOO00_00885, partial [Chitinophagaceae bacterium]